MSVHDQNELDRENRLVRENTRASLMSDTKWRKLLSALDRPGLELGRCVVKFIDAPEPKVMGRPRGLHPPLPWVDTPEFGPIPLRSIEWILFPSLAEYPRANAHVPARRVKQDVEKAAQLVNGLGKYPIEFTERGLMIVGHLPR